MNDILINARNIQPQQAEFHTATATNIDILANTIYGFIGPDSSRVSAWLQTLAAIAPPASGQVQFMGQNTEHPDRNTWQNLRIKLAYLNHHSALLSVLSTQENILLPALYHRLGTREALLEQLLVLLEKIGFADMNRLSKLPAYIDEVSYSQAMLVRMVLTRPKVIIIDNTLRHFDERTSRKMLAFIKDYQTSAGASLLLHDDDAEFVMKNADRIIYGDTDGLLQFNNRNELQASANPHVLQYLHELASH